MERVPIKTSEATLADSEIDPKLPFRLERRPCVTQVRHRTEPELLSATANAERDLAGFPDEYADIVDFIVKITRRIWVDGAIGLIYDTYDPNCVVYTAADVARGVDVVIEGTTVSMAVFPDLDNHFLNIAWSGNAIDGFYTSHLGFGTGLNIGDTIYGPATGKGATIRFCADCISLNGRIHTEWLARDNGALVRQLGIDLHGAARRLAAAPQHELYVRSAPQKLDGQTPPQLLGGPRETIEQHLRTLFHDLWNRRMLDQLAVHYDPGARLHTAGGRVGEGIGGIRALHLSLLAAMPDARMTISNVCWSSEVDGVIGAVRWELSGTSRAGGWFGAMPVGVPFAIPGMTHCRFGADGRIVEEWTVFDEVGVLAQVYRASFDA